MRMMMTTECSRPSALFGLWLLASLICNQLISTASQEQQEATAVVSLPTVTVRGFLNFKTTVDGTVIVFTPASEVPAVAATKPTDPPQISTNAILHSNALDSKDKEDVIQDLVYTQSNGLDVVKPREDLDQQAHRVKESFQHISDNAVLPSTVQTNNDLESEEKKNSPPQNQYPTGLVTVLGGTHIARGLTTIFETKVIGTYIDGKYAQILQSTSKIIGPTVDPSPTRYSSVISSKKDIKSVSSTLNMITSSVTSEILPTSTHSISSTLTLRASSVTTPILSTITRLSPSVEKSSSKLESHKMESAFTVSTFEKSVFADTKELTQDFTSRKSAIQSSFRLPDLMTTTSQKMRPTQTLESARSFSKTSTYHPVSSTARPVKDDTVLSSNRNLKTNSTRIRFIAPRRPSQTVRLNRFKVKLTLRQDSPDGYDLTTVPDEDDIEEEHSKEDEDELELQEPSILDGDPAKVIFRETTITSEVTLHVGRRKSVRTLTITTTVPLRINPTDVDLSLETTENPGFVMPAETDDGEDFEIQSVITRTFTTTERTLKTSLLPIFDGHTTSFHTVTESFFIMKIITGYRTLPPGSVTVLEEFDEIIPEIVPTLDVAANVQPSVVQSAPFQQTEQVASKQSMKLSEIQIEPSLPNTALTQGTIHPQLSDPLISLGAALSNNPLAAVYLGLQQLNAQITQYSTMIETSTYVKTDTIYNTKTIRFYDGRSTRFRTMSDPISTKKRTVTTTVTSVQPYINTQALQQQQQLQKLIAATQLSQPRQKFSTVTSTYTTVTTATSLSTRIYTLIYNGFSTKFRTVTSSTLYPTTVTVTSTKEVPLSGTPPPVVPFAYPYPA